MSIYRLCCFLITNPYLDALAVQTLRFSCKWLTFNMTEQIINGLQHWGALSDTILCCLNKWLCLTKIFHICAMSPENLFYPYVSFFRVNRGDRD